MLHTVNAATELMSTSKHL